MADLRKGDVKQIFSKAAAFGTANQLKAEGVYAYFCAVEQSTATEVLVEGRWRVMAGSNNYLGLTHHPRVLDAQHAALEKYGSGATTTFAPSPTGSGSAFSGARPAPSAGTGVTSELRSVLASVLGSKMSS